jgi:hypothetical protein
MNPGWWPAKRARVTRMKAIMDPKMGSPTWGLSLSKSLMVIFFFLDWLEYQLGGCRCGQNYEGECGGVGLGAHMRRWGRERDRERDKVTEEVGRQADL